MGTLTDIRMACHQLAEPEFGHPADLVGWMGAMQAQDYTMSKWAVGLRLKSATIAHTLAPAIATTRPSIILVSAGRS